MVHVEIFREPIYRSYRASECSWAAFYIKLCNIFRYFLPILVVFLTDGLWKKTNTFREVPDLSVTGDFIVYGYGSDRSIISSSYAVLNAAASTEQLSTSQLLHHISDVKDIENIPSTTKSLQVKFQMSTQNVSINTLIYAFSLKMKLGYHSVIETELFLTDTIQLPSATSSIETIGRVSIDQSIPFETSSSYEQFKIIDRRRESVEHYFIQSILKRITHSPLALKIDRKSTLLLSAPSTQSTLSLSLNLSISEMEFIYKTGFWELMKWFWIQYLAAFFISNSIFNSISSFLFQNHVFYCNDIVK